MTTPFFFYFAPDFVCFCYRENNTLFLYIGNLSLYLILCVFPIYRIIQYFLVYGYSLSFSLCPDYSLIYMTIQPFSFLVLAQPFPIQGYSLIYKEINTFSFVFCPGERAICFSYIVKTILFSSFCPRKCVFSLYRKQTLRKQYFPIYKY